MADEEPKDADSPGKKGSRSKDRSARPKRSFSLPSARQVGFGLFGALVGLALAFYLWWGISFGVWIDNGIYAMVITLAGFGLAGMWLTLPPKRRGLPAP